MTATQSPANARSLPLLCGEMVAFALNLRTAKDPGDADRLRESITTMFERLNQRARAANVDSAHLEAVRYALCALLDEIVLGSRWQIKTQWLNGPLQMTFFGDFTAGEQFFRRLDALREDFDHNRGAIEVYAQCLAAGFRGKYADLAGMQRIDDMLVELNAQLRKANGIQRDRLSKPHQREVSLQQEARKFPIWFVGAAGAGLVLILLLVFNGLLASQAAEFLASGATGR